MRNHNLNAPIFSLKQRCIFLAILLVVSILAFSNSARAQSNGYTIMIHNPTEGSTITTGKVTLSFSVTFSGPPLIWVKSMPARIYVDMQLYNDSAIDIAGNNTGGPWSSPDLVLSGLTPGTHRIQINVQAIGESIFADFDVNAGSASVNFKVVNLEIAPKLSISNLDEYKTSQASLNSTTDSPDAIVSYHLDGGANVTLPQNQTLQVQNGYLYNVTLSGLTNGTHTITAYAKDDFNNERTAEKTFNVSAPIQQPATSSSNPAVIAGFAFVVLVLLLASVLLLKRRNKSKNGKAA